MPKPAGTHASDFELLLIERLAADVAKRVESMLREHATRRLLDTAGVAAYLSISTDMVSSLVLRGLLPPAIPLGENPEGRRRTPRWDVRDLDAMVDRLKQLR